MVKRTALILLVLSLFTIIHAQDGVDLELQTNITDEYIAYILDKESNYLNVVADPQNDEATMQAYMGLTLINIVWNHVDVDSSVDNIDSLLSDIFFNWFDLIFEIEDNLSLIFEDAMLPEDVIFNLITYLKAGNLSQFQSALSSITNSIEESNAVFADSLDSLVSRLSDHFETAGEYFEALCDSTADFEFSFVIYGSEYEDSVFVVTREFLDLADFTAGKYEDFARTMDNGLSQLDSVFNTPDGDISPAIAEIRAGLAIFDECMQLTTDLVSMQPLAPLDIDTTVFDSLAAAADELDTLLAGQAYDVEINGSMVTVVPLAILEAIPNGLDKVVQEFYWETTNPYTYTFHGIFPDGLPADIADMIHQDLVLNAYSDKEEMDGLVELARSYFIYLLTTGFLGDNDPANDGDAHFGLALLTAYETFRDFEDNLYQVLFLLSEGKLDSVGLNYNFDIFNFSEKLDEISYHLEAILNDGYYTIFTILVKFDPDGEPAITWPPFTVDENDDFTITMITEYHMAAMYEFIQAFKYTTAQLDTLFSNAWEDINEIADLTLDPSYLDFSDVESDSDLILILEAANPDFLTLTPYGIERFYELGDEIENLTYDIATGLDSIYFLIDTLAVYQDSLNADLSGFLFGLDLASSMFWDIHTDFAYPDSALWNGTERVNLSAWFDNPPTSFLQMWKNYIFGVDSTLGGLFPDRSIASGAYELPVLPKKFKLYPVYPNPFNPVATIEFDLPRAADVRLSIINLNGETVYELLNGHYKAGKIISTWNAADFPSGIYFCRLSIDGKISTRKMTLMK